MPLRVNVALTSACDGCSGHIGEAIVLPVHCHVPSIHWIFPISAGGFIIAAADMADPAAAGFSACFLAACADAAERPGPRTRQMAKASALFMKTSFFSSFPFCEDNRSKSAARDRRDI